DFEFSQWNFLGNTEEEFQTLMNILKELEKEVYIADYEELGAKACRILVPCFSEVYEAEDLVWNNHNMGLSFRPSILNLHSLDDKELNTLLNSLSESDLDDYLLVSELIGIAFEDTSPWGKCTVGELKGLIYLALGKQEEAFE